MWDVTAERQMRERLSQAERMEALGLLAGGVAHDFNNQLAIILAEAEIIELANALSEAGRPHLQNITRAADASAALVRDLLAYSRRREIQRTALDLGDIVRQAARLATRSLAGVDLVTSIPPQVVPALCNAGQLQNAILNLCINARDALNEGGSIHLRVATEEVAAAACVVCGATFSGQYQVITVADNGSGIPEAVRGRIFEPFFTTKEEGKGTGLGLAAVLGCVATHDGHLTLDTAAGCGTTFRIHLPPLPAGYEVLAPPLMLAESSARHTGRLLLLEDQDSVREAIAVGLRRLGWDVLDFSEPQAAISAWQATPGHFDVALIDMLMPRMNGAKVFRSLRQADPQARVLLMSGHTGSEDLDALRAEGLAGFIEKPIRLRALAQLLTTVRGAL